MITTLRTMPNAMMIATEGRNGELYTVWRPFSNDCGFVYGYEYSVEIVVAGVEVVINADTPLHLYEARKMVHDEIMSDGPECFWANGKYIAVRWGTPTLPPRFVTSYKRLNENPYA
jgi:hypothetical protein